MKNIIVTGVLFVLLFCGLFVFFLKRAGDNTSDLFDKIDQIDEILLNSQVIISEDTLDIINSNWINESVTLENGVIYDYKYIESKFLNENTKVKIDSINKTY